MWKNLDLRHYCCRYWCSVRFHTWLLTKMVLFCFFAENCRITWTFIFKLSTAVLWRQDGIVIDHFCALERWRTFLCRHPEGNLWSRAQLLVPCPPCPCVGRRRWRVTWFWAGWWGVAWGDCCEPRWVSRWGSWERGPGCPEAQCCGPLWGWLASGEVYCDSCRKREHLWNCTQFTQTVGWYIRLD